MRFRRSKYIAFRIEEECFFDPIAFIEGEIQTSFLTRIEAWALASSNRTTLDPQRLTALLQVSESIWSDLSDSALDASEVEWFHQAGLVFSDRADDPLRLAEEELIRVGWAKEALRFHSESSLESNRISLPKDYAHLEKEADHRADRFIEAHGAPPPPYYSVGCKATIRLPYPDLDFGSPGFFDVLYRRRTHRSFSKSRALSKESLGTLLFHCFAPQAEVRLGKAFRTLRKTSPSGGAMHAIEAFALILNVSDISPGVYHYASETHELRLIENDDRSSLARRCVVASAQQDFLADAPVVVYFVARFGRNFWKYRGSTRTYAVLMQDLGALCQTFYLVAASLGLSAVYSGAVSVDEARRLMRLRSSSYEDALGVGACGYSP